MSEPVQNEMGASPERPDSRWKAKLAELFGIDARSLATFRIAIGTLLLADLAGRAGDLRAMLLDDGIMPRALLTTWYGSRWRWSLHWLNDSLAYQGALFCLAGLFAVALLLGYRTRLATIASWILLSSLHTRAPLIINGGDLLLRVLLFWSMFLPLGRAMSVDAWRTCRRAAGDGPIFSVGTVAVLLQVCVLYLSASMFKIMAGWSESNSLHQALAWGVYNKPFGDFLLGYPDALKALSLATLGLQMVGPVLLFVPWRTAQIRVVVIAAFLGFHLGTELSMHLALFSYVSMAAWMLFLPSTFWNSARIRRCGDWLSTLRTSSNVSSPATVPLPAVPTRYHQVTGWMASAICLACLLFVLTYNVVGLGKRYAQWTIPNASTLQKMGDITLLTQKWSMFAQPPTASGWYVAKARLKNGDEIDLLRDGKPVDWSRPAHIAQLSPNHRWRKFKVNLSLHRNPKTDARFQPFRQTYAEYLFRDWNARHGEERQVVVLDLVCVFKPVELGETTDTLRTTIDARVESSAIPIEDTLNFDFP